MKSTNESVEHIKFREDFPKIEPLNHYNGFVITLFYLKFT